STPGGNDGVRVVTTNTSLQYTRPLDWDEGFVAYVRVQAFSAANTLLAADSAIYSVCASCSGTGAVGAGYRFVPRQPCRAVDTRLGAGPSGGPALGPGESRDFDIRQACGIPPSAQAISANVTVVPDGPLGYLTLSQSLRPRPFVSTLNSTDGRIRS